jgi:catechol 2,3-dioxygenase
LYNGDEEVIPMSRYHGPHALRVSKLEIAVADLARAEAFYRDALGFSVTREEDGSAAVSADGTHVLLLLKEAPGVKPRGRTAGLFHVAFLLPSRAALGGFLRRAIASQIAIQGAADHGVSEAIYLADPDGNGIELYADTDDGSWRNASGELAMGTDPFDYTGVYYAADEAYEHLPEATVVGHVHLAAHDLDASLAFYRDLIGFAVTSDAFPAAYFMASEGYHHHLAINAWERAAGRKPDRAGLVSTTIAFSDCESAQAAIERVRTAKVPLTETATGYATIDPDGTIVRFTVA